MQELSRTWVGITNRKWAKGTGFLLSDESIAELTIPGGMDPFNSLPGGLCDETRLVHHCEPAYSFMQVLGVVLGWLI